MPAIPESVLNSTAAKAEMKAIWQKEMNAQALQANSPLKTRADIKGFWAQYPKARDLFGRIMTEWRGTSSRRPGVAGCWAAHPYQHWSERTALPVATLKRYLDMLQQHGLIERIRGHHQGNRVLAFIRPTALSLRLSDCRPQDWQHLAANPDEPTEPDWVPKPKPAPVFEAMPEPVPEPEKPATLAEFLEIMGAANDTNDTLPGTLD